MSQTENGPQLEPPRPQAVDLIDKDVSRNSERLSATTCPRETPDGTPTAAEALRLLSEQFSRVGGGRRQGLPSSAPAWSVRVSGDAIEVLFRAKDEDYLAMFFVYMMGLLGHRI